MLTYIYRLVSCGFLFLSSAALAAHSNSRPIGIGAAATNFMEPVTIMANFMGSLAIIVGLSFILGSFLKYLEFRANPYGAQFGTVIFLLLLGILLMLLPLAYMYTEGGIPLSL